MSSTAYEQLVCDGSGQLPGNTPLYRYLSTDSFLYLLGFRTLNFSRVSNWDDSQEGRRLGVTAMQATENPFDGKIVEDFYAMSWSMQTYDRRLFETDKEYVLSNDELKEMGSDAMWRAYCPTGGVRIQTTLGKFESLLLAANLPNCALFSGRVVYDPDDTKWEKTIRSRHVAAGLLQKRVCFWSESEFRFILRTSKKIDDAFVQLPVDNLYNLIDEVPVFPAKPHEIWKAQSLVRAASRIIPPPQSNDDESLRAYDSACSGKKNGQEFCRISQLYGEVPHPGL